MNFDFNIYNYEFENRSGLLEKEASGVVKGKKVFPIYTINGKENFFKPLSKTKPLTTPLFAFSEVFWSTVIKNYFDEKAPLYKLATCNGYEKEYPNRYSKGTIVESIVKPNQRLVNLLEYYIKNPDKNVDIDNYINYCGMYYDYTDILNSKIFSDNSQLGSDLAKQILISILKNDINYHYENVAFIYENNELKSVAPPIDHEFSLPFLYPDNNLAYLTYFGAYNNTLGKNEAETNRINLEAIINNIKVISTKYPEVTIDFIENLKKFISDFMNTDFIIPNDFMEPFSSNLYEVYDNIFKKTMDNQKLYEISKFSLKVLDIEKYSKIIQKDILISAINYYNLTTNLGHSYIKK